jgi:hypothetical protein
VPEVLSCLQLRYNLGGVEEMVTIPESNDAFSSIVNSARSDSTSNLPLSRPPVALAASSSDMMFLISKEAVLVSRQEEWMGIDVLKIGCVSVI